MARGIKGYFDFSKGVITEGSKLTYAENSLLDSLNMHFTPGSPLTKRLGMTSIESKDRYTNVSAPGWGNLVGTWFWETPGGHSSIPLVLFAFANNRILGIRVGDELTLEFSLDLSGAVVGGSFFDLTSDQISFSAIGDRLYSLHHGTLLGRTTSRVVVTRFPNLTESASFSSSYSQQLDIRYRDFGDASNLTLSDPMPTYRHAGDPDWFGDPSQKQYGQRGAILYDLFNRGWLWVTDVYWQSKFGVQDSYEPVWHPGAPAPQWFRQRLGRWPTKATTFVLGVTSDWRPHDDLPRVNQMWDADPFRTLSGNVGSSAKGHVILSAYAPNRWRTFMEMAGSPADGSYASSTPDPSNEVFTSIATWYGRVCFGTASGKVFMSQLYKDSEDDIAGKCYQDQDPTDRDFNELLDTDGTVLDLGGAGRITGMVPIGEFLIVLSNNGVYQIGGSTKSYSIKEISVSKLLQDSCNERNSILAFPGGVAFFADSAIYAVVRDPTVGTLNPQAITDDTIKQKYIDEYAEGVASVAYDYRNKRIEWVYSDGKILQFDTRTGGFFFHKLSGVEEVSGQMVLVHKIPREYIVNTTEDVTYFGETVTYFGDDVTVQVSELSDSPDTGLVYYRTHLNPQFQIDRGIITNRNLVDYGQYEYRAYAEAGYDTFNDPTSDKDIDTLFAWFEITEDAILEVPGGYELDNQSACDLSVKWEWSSSSKSNRWYNIGNIYKLPVEYIVDDDDLTLDLAYSVTTAETGIWGAGKSVVFRFDDQPGKHMRILGWAVTASNEENP